MAKRKGGRNHEQAEIHTLRRLERGAGNGVIDVNPLRARIAMCVVLAPAWVACSLQDFDYLTKGTGVSVPEGGVDSSADVAAQDAAQDDASSSDSGGSEVSQPASDGGTDGTSVDARADAGGPTNYIVNGNFDDGTLSGWTVAPSAAEYTEIKTQIAADFGNTPPRGKPTSSRAMTQTADSRSTYRKRPPTCRTASTRSLAGSAGGRTTRFTSTPRGAGTRG